MRASHRCDTCQGSGLACDCQHAPVMHVRRNYLIRCQSFGCGCETWECETCAGSGTLPDQMPVSDALADAETLRRVLGQPTWEEIDKRTTERGRIAAARFYGDEASRWMAERYPSSDAILYSINAAFEALRAVPGLRG